MGKPEESLKDPRPSRRKTFSGTRALLATVVVVALGLGGLAHAHRQAERRTVLMAELTRSGMHPMLNEMTYLDEIVKKYWPRREAWLRGTIGGGWLDCPTVFNGQKLDDERVPEIARKLRELGTVREVHYGGDRLTEAGIARLRAELPGVNVVPYDVPELHHYSRASMGEHLAYGALGFMIAVATTALGLLVVAIRWLIRRLRAAGRPFAPLEPGHP